VEADDKVGVTPPTDAIEVHERDDAGESAEAAADAVGAAGPVDETGPGDEAGPKGDAGPKDEAGPGDDAGPGDGAAPDVFSLWPEFGAGGDGAVAKTAGPDRAPETIPAAVTEALPAAEPVAAAQTAPAAETAAPTATGGGPRRPSWKIATAAAAVAVIVIALVIVSVNSSAVASHKTTHKKKAEPITVASVSPSNGSTGVNGASPITVTYSGRITSHTPLPTLSPSIEGSWQVSGDKATFIPQVGYTENTHVTVNIPAPAGTATTAATSFSFTTGQYSMLRLEQLLSQLGYLPVTWTPTDSSGDIPSTDASAQLAAAYDPPSGTFTFDSGYPAALTSQWTVGTNNEIIDGAVRTFEYDQGLNIDGDAGPHVWRHLLTAIAKGEQSQHGYTYVWVTQAGTEHLDLYHNGNLAITSPVNTGIPASPTVDGTFPVYLRYTVTQMQGLNPDGTPYDDTVYWVSYFNGGDAVHAFPRGGYGWYQSLGCVELPYDGSGPGVAENVWNLITYGTLVTVTGPVA
jgi:hypothetical protein